MCICLILSKRFVLFHLLCLIFFSSVVLCYIHNSAAELGEIITWFLLRPFCIHVNKTVRYLLGDLLIQRRLLVFTNFSIIL